MVNNLQQIRERTENIKAFKEVIHRDHRGKVARFARAAGVPENFMGQVQKYMIEAVMLRPHILALLVEYTEMRNALATTAVPLAEQVATQVDEQDAAAVAALPEATSQAAAALGAAPRAAVDRPPVMKDRWKVLHAQVRNAREAFRRAIAEFEDVPVTAVVISHTVESRF